jgi:hypothetical protein
LLKKNMERKRKSQWRRLAKGGFFDLLLEGLTVRRSQPLVPFMPPDP